MLNGYDQALLEAAPMSDILAKVNTVNDTTDALKLGKIIPSIEFKNASYRYSDSIEDVLVNVSLNIKPARKNWPGRTFWSWQNHNCSFIIAV